MLGAWLGENQVKCGLNRAFPVVRLELKRLAKLIADANGQRMTLAGAADREAGQVRPAGG